MKSNFRLHSTLVMLGLGIIILTTWAYFIGKTGFYWDDWPVIWVYAEQGVDGIRKYFSSDRPVYGHVYSLLIPIFGFAKIPWFSLLLFSVFVMAITWFNFLIDLWPKQYSRAWLAASFLAVYPGFMHHGIAFTYSQHFVSGFLFVVSLHASFIAVKNTCLRSFFWIIVSTITALSSFFLIEYFIGLEFVRPYILYIAFRRKFGDSISFKNIIIKIANQWIATLSAFLVFMFFQSYFLNPLGYRNVSTVLGKFEFNFSYIILTKLKIFIINFLATTLSSWFRTLDYNSINLNYGKSVIASWLVFVIVMAVVVIIFLFFKKNNSNKLESNDLHARECFYLSILLLIFAGIPYVAADIRIDLDTITRDRFSISFMFGSSLLLAFVITSISKKCIYAAVIGGIFIGAASAFQFRATNELRSDWENQRNIFWQFAWRFPVLKQGTTVYAEGLPLLLTGNQAAANLNLLYGNAGSLGDIDYIILDLNHTSIHTLAPDPTFEQVTAGKLRSFEFHGTTSQAIAMWIPQNNYNFGNHERSSIRFLDSVNSDEIPFLGPESRMVAHQSRPNKVTDAKLIFGTGSTSLPAGPLLKIIGPEPLHSWEYYFQKAELARQNNDWDQIVMLEIEANKKGLEPLSSSELHPFIEARIRRGEIKEALQLTRKNLTLSPYELIFTIRLWKRIINNNNVLFGKINDIDPELYIKLNLDK